MFQELYCFPAFVSISCIGIVFPYCVIRQSISVLISLNMLSLDMLTHVCYHLTPNICTLSPDTSHVKTWLIIITLQECNNWYPSSYTPVHLYSWYFWHAPAHFCILIIIINYKNDNLHQIKKKLMDFNLWLRLQWFRYVVQLKLRFYLRASRCSEGCASTPPYLYIHLFPRACNMTLSPSLRGEFQLSYRNTLECGPG